MRKLLFLSFLTLGLSLPAFAADEGTYRPGNAYHSVMARSASQCAAQCKGDAQCKGWNFVRPRQLSRSGVCEFNAIKVSAVPSAVSVSGENMTARSSSQIIPSGGNTMRIQSEPVITPPLQSRAAHTSRSTQPSMQNASSASRQAPSYHVPAPVRQNQFARGMETLAGANPQAKLRYDLEAGIPNAAPRPQHPVGATPGYNRMDHNQMSRNQMGQNQMAPNHVAPNQMGHNPARYDRRLHNQMAYADPRMLEAEAARRQHMQSPYAQPQSARSVPYQPQPQARSPFEPRQYGSTHASPMPERSSPPASYNNRLQAVAVPGQHAPMAQPRMMPSGQAPHMMQPRAPRFAHNLDGRQRANIDAPNYGAPNSQASMPIDPRRAYPARAQSAVAPQFQHMMGGPTMPRAHMPQAPMHQSQAPQRDMMAQPRMMPPAYGAPQPQSAPMPRMSAPQYQQAPQMQSQPTRAPQPGMAPQMAPKMAMEPHMMAQPQSMQPQMPPQMMPSRAPQAQVSAQPPYGAAPNVSMLRRPMTAAQAEQSLFGSLHDDVTVPVSLLPQHIPADPNAPIPTVRRIPTGEIATAQLPPL